MSQDYQFSGVNHITVTVRDMEKSLHFYRDMIGFKVLRDTYSAHKTDRANLAHRAPRAGHRMVALDTGGGPHVSLTEYPEASGGGVLLDDAGVTHFAVTVSDLPALTRKMLAMGAKSPRPGFFADPDGTLVQFQDTAHIEAALQRYGPLGQPR